jgi:hypothetical protein
MKNTAWLRGKPRFVHAVHRLVVHSAFDYIMIVIIIANSVTLALSHHGMSTSMERGLVIANVVFTAAFSLEMALKLTSAWWRCVVFLFVVRLARPHCDPCLVTRRHRLSLVLQQSLVPVRLRCRRAQLGGDRNRSVVVGVGTTSRCVLPPVSRSPLFCRFGRRVLCVAIVSRGALCVVCMTSPLLLRVDAGGGSGVASVFRSFRLLRILKLAKSFPSLRMLLVTVVRSVSNVAYLTVLLFLFMFLFAVMGVQCKSAVLSGVFPFSLFWFCSVLIRSVPF